MPRLQVSGRDFLDSMMKDSRPYTWENMTYKQVVEDIITKKYKSKYKIKNLEIGDTKIKCSTISQNQKSDFQFIKEIAEENNFELFARGDAFFFRERPKKEEPVVTLEWGRSLLSFSPEVNLSGQVSEVNLTGWDHNKKLIKGKSNSSGFSGTGGKSGRELVKENYGECSVMHRHVMAQSQEEADIKAEAIHKNIENKLVTGNGESIGLPEIRTGMYIGLKGLGKKFSRSYYLVSTEHTVSSSGYRTNFNVEANNI
jgi:phage protein D